MGRQWLVQWKRKAMEDATWEDELILKRQFPDLSFEDKTVIPAVGSDGMMKVC